MGIHDLANDEEAEADPLPRPAPASAPLPKRIEHVRKHLGRNRITVVSDGEFDHVLGGAKTHPDRAARRPVVESVAQEIRDHLLDAIRIERSGGRPSAPVLGVHHALVALRGAELFDHLTNHRRQIDVPALDGEHLTREAHARQVEEIAYERGRALVCGDDPLDVPAGVDAELRRIEQATILHGIEGIFACRPLPALPPVEGALLPAHPMALMPSLSVVPISVSHLARTGRLLARALDDDPAYRFLFPSAATRPRGLADFFVRNLRTHLPYRGTYVLAEDDAVVATVTLRPPGGVPVSALTMLRRGLIPFAIRNGPASVRRLLRLKRAYDEIEERASGRPHLLVHMMAVAPERQGTGIGTRLLDDAIALSIHAHRAASHPIVLTTHKERNVTFYRKSGFGVTEQRDVKFDGAAAYPVWSMSRGG